MALRRTGIGGALCLALLLLLVALGTHLTKQTRPSTRLSLHDMTFESYGNRNFNEIKGLFGDPLFICSDYTIGPFEDGQTQSPTQITFLDVISAHEYSESPHAWPTKHAVYSSTRQAAVTVKSVLARASVDCNYTGDLASYWPRGYFVIVHILGENFISDITHVEKMHAKFVPVAKQPLILED